MAIEDEGTFVPESETGEQQQQRQELREKVSEISFEQLKRGDTIYTITKGYPDEGDFPMSYKIEVLGIRKNGLQVKVSEASENPQQSRTEEYYAVLPGVNTTKKSFFDSVEPRVIRASSEDEKCWFEFRTLRYTPKGEIEARGKGSWPIQSLELERSPER